MESSDVSPGPARHLLQAGSVLFLLALFVGLAIPRFALPRVAVSAHLVGLMQGMFLMLAGLLWPRLGLSRRVSGIAGGLLIYGGAAAFAANLCAAACGAGGTLLPIATGGVQGSALAEGAVKTLLRTAAVSIISGAGLVFWGLRTPHAAPLPAGRGVSCE